MSRFKVVGISGKQGSGKSTLASELALINLRDWEVHILKFATPLYRMHDAVLRIAKDHGLSPDTKEGKLLQLIGTEWGRERFGPNVWVNCLEEKLEDIGSHAISDTLIIVDDMRFPNEFECLHALECEVSLVRLECDEDVREARCPAWRGGEGITHTSEIALDKEDRWTHVVDTDLIDKNCMANVAASLMKGDT